MIALFGLLLFLLASLLFIVGSRRPAIASQGEPRIRNFVALFFFVCTVFTPALAGLGGGFGLIVIEGLTDDPRPFWDVASWSLLFAVPADQGFRSFAGTVVIIAGIGVALGAIRGFVIFLFIAGCSINGSKAGLIYTFAVTWCVLVVCGFALGARDAGLGLLVSVMLATLTSLILVPLVWRMRRVLGIAPFFVSRRFESNDVVQKG